MSAKIYLNLLILGAVLSQRILATFLEDDDEDSSNLLSRKKRVIDNLPENEIPTVPELFYIVKVLHNLIYICNGIIVSPLHILTARICSEKAAVPTELQVETGDINMGPIYFGAHFVLEIAQEGDLALLLLSCAIAETAHWHRRIEPDDEVLLRRSFVFIAGWQRIRNIYRRRKAAAQVLGSRSCQAHFRAPNRYAITENHICTTMLPGERGFTHEDSGAALVIENKLVGVLVFGGYDLPGGPKPDVFIRVNAENGYYNWIKSNIRSSIHSSEGLNLRPYDYTEQPQTLFYRTVGENNRFLHPHPEHFSHPRPNLPPPL